MMLKYFRNVTIYQDSAIIQNPRTYFDGLTRGNMPLCLKTSCLLMFSIKKTGGYIEMV